MENHVSIMPKESAQRHTAEKRGQNFLEFINLWKTKVSYNWRMNQTGLARTGIEIQVDDDDESTLVTAVPAIINYDVWFWTLSLYTHELVTDKLLFWNQENPSLDLTYNTNFPIEFNVSLKDIVDESTTGIKYEKGQYYTQKIGVEVQGYILKSLTQKAIRSIIMKLYDGSALTDQNMIDMVIGEQEIDSQRREALLLWSGENCSVCTT
jgi:hypothetical protein